ncbi:DUF1223 domain-containing protein [Chromobacterium alticapitis]|uniref:DUF1223 domain-containing protein n=1 Tax=Chromobacterium alticapitis TaxID=2073169 RepID=A0A2S5DHH4_9NEIS|nr:DUF1223 domain-containing protein [Chromobacterium alticapitis]POZ62448.1 DUF1223 domain-containing protein [Chromobacterium alticapitis]
MWMRFVLACLGWAVCQTAAAACSVQAESGARRVALLELYTSEGCSSCPPADAWLSGLAAAGIGRRQAVPLAFHVDYWDGLGWRDRFASADYSRRQREAAARDGRGLVYTPQLRLNGQDWSAAGYEGLRAALSAGAAAPSLTLTLAASGDGVDVSAQAAGAPASARLMLALYENGLQSRVAAGENAGRLLRHDAVVRMLVGPLPLLAGKSTLRRHLAFAPGQREASSGVAAWLEDEAGHSLQAVAAVCSGG